MSKRITNTVVALVFGASVVAGIGIAVPGTAEPANADANANEKVAGLTPYHACEVTYINYPRRHTCDRRGHVHWL